MKSLIPNAALVVFLIGCSPSGTPTPSPRSGAPVNLVCDVSSDHALSQLNPLGTNVGDLVSYEGRVHLTLRTAEGVAIDDAVALVIAKKAEGMIGALLITSKAYTVDEIVAEIDRLIVLFKLNRKTLDDWGRAAKNDPARCDLFYTIANDRTPRVSIEVKRSLSKDRPFCFFLDLSWRECAHCGAREPSASSPR